MRGIMVMNQNNKDQLMPEKKLMKFKEFAQAISVSTRQLWRMINSGDVPQPIKQGRTRYFFAEDLESHLTKLRKQRS